MVSYCFQSFFLACHDRYFKGKILLSEMKPGELECDMNFWSILTKKSAIFSSPILRLLFYEKVIPVLKGIGKIRIVIETVMFWTSEGHRYLCSPVLAMKCDLGLLFDLAFIYLCLAALPQRNQAIFLSPNFCM